MATPPMSHAMVAAGPAFRSALRAPKSHPDPMIEPSDAHSSPTNPMSRRRDLDPVGTVWMGVASAMAMTAPLWIRLEAPVSRRGLCHRDSDRRLDRGNAHDEWSEWPRRLHPRLRGIRGGHNAAV